MPNNESTFVVAATIVGSVIMTHGRSPLAAWGVTAINPDVTDIYIETLDKDLYLAYDDQWKPIQQFTEKIKVRFGTDVDHVIKYTQNGVILP